MEPKSSAPLNAQRLLAQQVTKLAGDGAFDQDEEYPQLGSTKMPDLKHFRDSNEFDIYKSRLRAYDLIYKALERHTAEHISEAHQRLLMDAIRRDIGPVLTTFPGTAPAKTPSATQPSSPTPLQLHLAKAIIKALTHILKSNLGPQFTRRSIGLVVRLVTNIILFSSDKQLVQLSLWLISLWRFDVDTIPMVSRELEAIDRAEEAALAAQGWAPFLACSNWKETKLRPDSDSVASFDSVSVEWQEPHHVLASSLDLVSRGRTSARLVSLVDSISFVICNPLRHNSVSVRMEALKALQWLLRTLPSHMMLLQSRWLHVAYISIFDSGIPSDQYELVYDILMGVARHLSTEAPNPTASHILLYCLTAHNTTSSGKDSGGNTSSKPNEDKAAYAILPTIQERFASADKSLVLRTVSAWGPLILIIGSGLFKHNMINVMLKFLQTTFTDMDTAIRAASYNAWSYLTAVFCHTPGGAHMVKRLRLLLLPIARAFTQETDHQVLHAAFDTFVRLLSSVRSNMSLDWPIIVSQPLQLLLKNPSSFEKFTLASPARTGANTSLPSSSPSSTSTNTEPRQPLKLSIIDRFCLLVCHMLRNTPTPLSSDVLSSSSFFDPNSPLRLAPISTKELDSMKDCKSWNMDVVAMERNLHKLLANDPHAQRSLLGITPPTFSSPASTYSFLSLVLSWLAHYMNDPYSGPPDPNSGAQDCATNVGLARALWSSLCLNLDIYRPGSGNRESSKHENEEEPVKVKNIPLDAPNILGWSLTQLLIQWSSSISLKDENITALWENLALDATKIATLAHPSLAYGDSQMATPYDNSTFSRFCQWIICPSFMEYPEAAEGQQSSGDGEANRTFSSVGYFGICDTLGDSFDQLGKSSQWTPGNMWSRESVGEYSAILGRGTENMLSLFTNGIPYSYCVLGIMDSILSKIRLTSTYSRLQHIALDIILSQDWGSPSLQDGLFRVRTAFTLWQILAPSLSKYIQNTAQIYPQHIYGNPPPPSALQQTFDPPGATLEKEGTSLRPSTTTLPTLHSVGLPIPSSTPVARDKAEQLFPSSPPRKPSSTSSPVSPGNHPNEFSSTTTYVTDGDASKSTRTTYTSSDSIFVIETKHPMVMLSSAISCILFPMNHLKALLAFMASIQESSHPGAHFLINHLRVKILGVSDVERIQTLLDELLSNVRRTCKHRFVDASQIPSLPHSTSQKPPPSSSNQHKTPKLKPHDGPFVSLKSIFDLMLIQLMHQLRDPPTFRQNDSNDSLLASSSQWNSPGTQSSATGQHGPSTSPSSSTQASSQQNPSTSKLNMTLKFSRLAYLSIWQYLFINLVSSFNSSQPIFRQQTPAQEYLWKSKNIISLSTCDLPKDEANASSAKLEARISALTLFKASLLTSTQEKVKELESFSPYFKEDVDVLFDLATPDWNLLSPSPELMAHSSGSSQKKTATSHLDFPLFFDLPHPDDTGNEAEMSGFSKLMRRIVCCLGMLWRSALMLYSKGTPASDGPFFTSRKDATGNDLVVSMAQTCLNSALSLIENWQFGYNLLLDVLPVMCWALGSDSAAAKVMRHTSSETVKILKKPMANLAGAIVACVSRAFTSLLPQNEEHGSALSASKYVIQCTPSIAALFLRSARIWQLMFGSQRSDVRTSAWRCWSASLGTVASIDPTLNGDLAKLLLKAHSDYPTEVLLAEAEKWKDLLNPKVKSERTTEMDVDSIPVPGTLFPIDSKHTHAPQFSDSLEAPPSHIGASATIPFNPNVKPPVPSVPKSPHKVLPGNSSATFVPLKTTFRQTTPPSSNENTSITAGKASHDTTKSTTGFAPASSPKKTPIAEKYEDVPPTHVLPEVEDKIGPLKAATSFAEWRRTLQSLHSSCEQCLNDPSITTSQLGEAQMEILELASQIAHRLSKN